MNIKKIPELQDVKKNLIELLDNEEYDLLVELVYEYGENIEETPFKFSMSFKTFLVKSFGELYTVLIVSDYMNGTFDCIRAGYTPTVQRVTLEESVSYEIVPCS